MILKIMLEFWRDVGKMVERESEEPFLRKLDSEKLSNGRVVCENYQDDGFWICSVSIL